MNMASIPIQLVVSPTIKKVYMLASQNKSSLVEHKSEKFNPVWIFPAVLHTCHTWIDPLFSCLYILFLEINIIKCILTSLTQIVCCCFFFQRWNFTLWKYQYLWSWATFKSPAKKSKSFKKNNR